MNREEAEKLKAEIAATQDTFRRAEHLAIANQQHRLENEINDARTLAEENDAYKPLQEARDKASAEHARIDALRDEETKSQQEFVERQVTPGADRDRDESIAASVHANQEMARQQLEAARHLQELHQDKAMAHAASLAASEDERRRRDEERSRE